MEISREASKCKFKATVWQEVKWEIFTVDYGPYIQLEVLEQNIE